MTRFSQLFTAGAIAAMLVTSAQAQTQTASPLGTQGLLNGQTDRLNENSTLRAETSPWTQNQITTRTVTLPAAPRVTPPNPIDDRSRFPQLWSRGRAAPVTEVNLSGTHTPGNIIIDTQKQFLYVTGANGRATRFPIVVGRAGFELRNTRFTVEEKMENPTWEAPAGYTRPNPFATPGPNNPLGVRGMYLAAGTANNTTENYTVQTERYSIMIHGTNDGSRFNLPDGQRRASAGCIRLLNEDVIRFYNMVSVGAQVRVINDPALMPRVTPVSAATGAAPTASGPRI